MKKSLIYLVEFTLVLLILCTVDYSKPLVSEQIRSALINLDLGESEICRFEGLDSIETLIISDQISDEEIKEKIDEILYENAYRNNIKNRTIIQQGDLVIADLKFMESENVILYLPEEPIRVGSGNYNLKLEHQLVGMDIRIPQTLTWSIPKDFFIQEYAGKDLSLLISFKQLCQVEVPSIEEYISSIGIYDKYEFVETIKEELAREKRRQQINKTMEEFYDNVAERCTFKMDNNEISENAISIFFDRIGYYDMFNCLMEENGPIEKDIYSQCCIESENEIKRFLIDGIIAKEWGITISDDQIDTYMLNKNIREVSDKEKSEIILFLVEDAIRTEYVNNYIEG